MSLDLPTLRDYWDTLIKEDERVLRLYARFIAFVLALSVALGIIGGVALFDSNTARYMLQVGAACIAVVGNALPAHQTFSCYQRLRWSRLIRGLLIEPPPPSAETVEFAEKTFWERLAKGAQ
jgi:hypothetical protein